MVLLNNPGNALEFVKKSSFVWSGFSVPLGLDATTGFETPTLPAAYDIEKCNKCKTAAMSGIPEDWYKVCRSLPEGASALWEQCWAATWSGPLRSNFCQTNFCNRF